MAPSGSSPSLPPDDLVDLVDGGRVILVLGEADLGKTSLVTRLANEATARGESVGIVDADVGQSEIGPPTTIALGSVERTLQRPSEARRIALHFVGATSPAANLLAVVVGTRKMLDRALAAGFDRVLVDTSGLVAGDLGQRLKHAKIDLVDPDVLVCLQRDTECEPILCRYAAGGRPRVVRLAPLPGVTGRSPEERRRRRQRAFAAYFAGARPVELDLERVFLNRAGEEVAEGTLAGLEDAARETLGVGRVLGLEEGRLTLEATVDPRRVASVVLGRDKYTP